MTQYYQLFTESLFGLIDSVQIEDRDGNEVGRDAALDRLCELSARVAEQGATQYLCGNGASAAFANHMAIDWSKNGKVATRSFSDSALLTAVANDMGAEEMFSAPLAFYAKEGDILVTVSSSGNSPNILRAIAKGREKSMDVVTFSGLKPDNASRKSGDINIYVPGKTYGMVECAHQILLHMWLDRYMGITEWDRNVFQNMRQDVYQL